MALANTTDSVPRNPAGRSVRTNADGENVSPDGIPLDQWGRPRIRPRAGAPMPGKRGGWQRASTLGGMLEDGHGISEWRQRNVLIGAANRPSIGLRVKDIDDPKGAGKALVAELVKEAHEVADTDEAARVGTVLHALTERSDAGQDLGDLGPNGPCIRAYEQLRDSTFEIIASELRVVWDRHQLTGRFDKLIRLTRDLVFTLDDVEHVIPKGTILIVDLKTAQTSDYFGVKFAVQLAVYGFGALYDHDGDPANGIAPGTRTAHGASSRWGLIVHMPSGGAMAALHVVDLAAGAELVEHALMVKADRKRKGLVVPVATVREPADVAVVTTVPAGPHADGLTDAGPGSDIVPIRYAGSDDGVRTTAEVERWVETGERVPRAARIADKVQGAHARRQAAEAAQREMDRDAAILMAIRKVDDPDQLVTLWRAHRVHWNDAHTQAAAERKAQLAALPV